MSGSRTTQRTLHDGWEVREIGPADIPHSDLAAWLPAVVPGHVHLDLERAGVIPDPFVRMHERAVQWVDERDWVYRCAFEVSAAELAGARHLLRFCGLDTVAEIRLNDEVVGATDNMFVPLELDVTGALVEGSNVLEVHFASAQRVGDERRDAALADPELAPHRRGLLSRSMVRKAQYMYGWDWGPRLRGCGIWQDVTLVRVPVARLGDWSWSAAFLPSGACDVTVQASVDGPCDEVQASLLLDGTAVASGSAAAGGAVVLRVESPERWWPADLGAPVLYELHVEVVAGDEVVDAVDGRVGLREVELVREPDAVGESFGFRVNGVDMFAKGANWIPDDSFPARTTRDRVRVQLELARDCGMNMLRVWGGGLYESEDFYGACDELGLLVWQDFAYACALYPEDDAAVEVAEEEARAAVRRIRNHPSLALWCGNNENQWLAGLGAYGRAPKVLGERLYHEVLPAVVAAEDPGRPYWPSSPYGTGTDKSGYDDGDCHDWNVWHGAGDWRHYSSCTARFVSEFGFAAPPDLRTLEEVLDPEDLEVDTPAMRWHDKTGKGYETYLGYIALHYPAPQTVEELVHVGQLNQADAMRFGIEHFRRLRPHTMGTLAWQLNDCWPVQSWAWVDHRLRPKAAWYAAKRFYAPLLLSLWRDGDDLHATLVNDALEPRSGTLSVRAVDARGTELWSVSQDASVGAGASDEVLHVALPDAVLDASRSAIVHATFADVDALLLLAEPKELELPAPSITVDTTPIDGGVRAVVTSDVLAPGVMLSLDGDDAVWSDRFLDLLPGEPREVTVHADLPADELASRLRWRALRYDDGSAAAVVRD